MTLSPAIMECSSIIAELAPKLERGFHLASEVVRPERRLVVYGGVERFPLGPDAEAVSLIELCEELSVA